MQLRRSRTHSDDPEERRRQESLKLDREALRKADQGLELARKNNRLQAAAVSLAALAIVVTVVIFWQPWSNGAQLPAHALVQLVSPHNALIPKRIDQIGVPPSYSAGESGDHCGIWWKSWFAEQGAAATNNPTIEISAPQNADVTVTSASIRIYGSYKPSALSFIECLHGAGPSPGTLLNVNLNHPNANPTIVSDSGQLTPLAMPNAVINIAPGRTEYVALTPTGTRNELYSWAVRLRIIVNQQSQTFIFGTPGKPLRSWFGPILSKQYDYSFRTNSWQVIG